MFEQLKLRLRNKIKIKGENNHDISIAGSAKLRNCRIFISGEANRLIIKDNVRIRDACFEIIGSHCSIVIDQNCVIGGGCYLSSRERGTSLVIGEGGMLSRNVKLMTSDGHDIIRQGLRVNPAKNITIGSKVWLADNVTVLKGVVVGNGAVVGINSTLTKDIPENAIAGGNPAKILSSDIVWDNKLTF